MPKIICTTCQTDYKIYKNGIYVIEMFLNSPQPYRIWSADLWKCRGCGNEVVNGFGNNPLAEHFQDDFQDMLEIAKFSENPVYIYEKPQY